MIKGKRFGPGERLSSRPGGDMASDEDDVQGHAFARATGVPGAPTGRIEPMGVNTKGLKASDDDDTEGHRAGAIRASDDDDTEGHTLNRAR